jgi:hypothetical protein
MHLIVTGPEGGRPAAPVAARIPLDRINNQRMIGLIDEDADQPVAVQVDSRGRLCWLQPPLEPGQVQRYRLDPAAFVADVSRVIVREMDDGSADITQDGRIVARYIGRPDAHRPFLSPIHSPAGHEVTVDQGHAPADTAEPRHHHSCWAGWADINGVDHWTDAAGAGVQRHRRFTLSSSGPVFGRVSALIEWLDQRGARQFCEQRVFTVYAGLGGRRIIDVISRMIMCNGPVTFGDTVDGGLCALRVGQALAPRGGGMIRNANGEEGEAECWGSAAAWCDLVGEMDGRFVGVAVMDSPENLRHPTHWNVRADGLLAANPFGLSGFLHDPHVTGGRSFDAGSSFMSRYRLLVHEGSPKVDDVARSYTCFSQPLKIAVE